LAEDKHNSPEERGPTSWLIQDAPQVIHHYRQWNAFYQPAIGDPVTTVVEVWCMQSVWVGMNCCNTGMSSV